MASFARLRLKGVYYATPPANLYRCFPPCSHMWNESFIAYLCSNVKISVGVNGHQTMYRTISYYSLKFWGKTNHSPCTFTPRDQYSWKYEKLLCGLIYRILTNCIYIYWSINRLGTALKKRKKLASSFVEKFTLKKIQIK